MQNMILTGFSGAGKSAVGQEAARLLGWQFVDTDLEVTRAAGKSIARIFGEDGEPTFRRLEAIALATTCTLQQTVIATGGGAIVDEENRSLMLRSGIVICLEAHPRTIHNRIASSGPHMDQTKVRPLLEGPDPLTRIANYKRDRQSSYSLAHWTIHTDALTVTEVAREAVHAWELLHNRIGVSPENPTSVDPEIAAVVHSASSGPCPIYVGWDTLNSLGQRCSSNGLKGVAYLLTDDAVGPFHASHVRTALEEAGIPSHVFTIPRGESSKTLDNAARCYRWLAEQHAERGHFIVALGGGVVGDLAGFVAATFNRGMPFVQIPTSLAAMVDASIGGKTAVDLPTGKNLVGAFYQPRFVLADVHTLYTLPKREMASGWAEAIKHSLILDTDLFDTFESQIEAIKSLEQPLATNVIKRSIAIKAQVVTQDEKETSGLRILLNYGHTLGHALETATSYKEYLHGEAVAVGMTAAARISQEMGLLDTEEATRQERLLQAYELPTRCLGVGVDEISSAMSRDKKTSGGSLRWVLLDRIGHALTRDDVPQALVEAVIRELT